ncbi:MAG TPA: acyl carrier protein [Chthoniobacterales bacterium]
MSAPLTDTRRATIIHALKRCDDTAVSAALEFQQTRDAAHIQPVIHGLIRREMPEENATDLATAPSETRLIEDLGLDSLALMEIVMSAEEVFDIKIENNELKQIATLAGLSVFVQTKLSSAPSAETN